MLFACPAIAAAMLGCSGDSTAPYVRGSLLLNAVTSGSSKDAGYLISVDGLPARFLPSSGSVVISNLSPTQHTLRVAGVAPNCALSRPAIRTITIANGATLTDSVSVACDSVTPRIMYGSSVENRYNLFTMDGDGSHIAQFTTDTAYHGQWSPDGSQVVFMSPKSGVDQLYMVDSLGQNERQLTTGDFNHDYPQWSPDGSRIAFTSGADTWTMAPDGTGAQKIYDIGANGPVSWSPDGTQIAQGSGSDIVIINADGTSPRQITHSAGFTSTEPAWSPDGTRIAFFTNQDTFLNIYVMNVDGSNIVKLTDSPYGVLNDQVAWSPDGSRLAFRTSRDSGQPNIYLMNPDGSNQTRITHNDGDNYGPSWHP